MTQTRGITEIVYVCSPDRRDEILPSLDSLFGSGSDFDRVRICLIGHKDGRWEFRHPKIVVETQAAMFGDYFYGNKLYLCGSDASRVVFLDTDTIILRPLQEIWNGNDSDLLARVASSYGAKNWKTSVWQRTCDQFGVDVVPMFNAGLLVFQNDSHRRIAPAWKEFIEGYRQGSIEIPFPDERMLEQFGLALAVGREKIQYSELSARAHAFGWMHDDYSDAVLLHTSGPRHKSFLSQVRRDPSRAMLLRPRVGRASDVLLRRIVDLGNRVQAMARGALRRRLTPGVR